MSIFFRVLCVGFGFAAWIRRVGLLPDVQGLQRIPKAAFGVRCYASGSCSGAAKLLLMAGGYTKVHEVGVRTRTHLVDGFGAY
jgi:hypothetical protein